MHQDPNQHTALTGPRHRLREGAQVVRLYYVPAIAIGLCYLAITMMWTLYAAYVPVFLDADFGLRSDGDRRGDDAGQPGVAVHAAMDRRAQ